MNFTELQVEEAIIKALREEGITIPTTIQERAIPLLHEGRDVIGISRTGSGKTASFAVPLLEKTTEKQGIQGLVLAPTRELANQISKEMRKWAKYTNIKIATVFGGVGFEPQVDAISKSQLVVGTPGRVLDHINRNSLRLTKLHTFVLDEADKMVEMGFIEDIEEILQKAPKDRQIVLFGATISNEVDYLKRAYMNNPATAEAELHVKKDLLKQYYYNVQQNQKFSLLVHLLKKEADAGRVIIFCSKRSTVELVQKNLRNNGIKAEMIHGKMSQNKRLHVMERFNQGKVQFLIASAVAARGLDIRDVTHVYNYDLSQDPQEYIHRVGRTARAGEEGQAITLLSQHDFGTFGQIIDRYKIPVEELPEEHFPRVRFEVPQRPFAGPRRQHRRPQRGYGRSKRR
jgi:superfamily II DNA/RNA helicase